MGRPIIRVLDTVHCRANKEARGLILPALAYKNTVWKRSRFGRSQTVEKSHLITGRTGSSGQFLTGLLPRVKRYFRKRGHQIKIIGHEEFIHPSFPPNLKDIIFRPEQYKALRTARQKQRGRIVFPTGSGKTLIALGIHSMFEDVHTLFLCHTKDLLNQSYDEAKKYFKNTIKIGGGHKTEWSNIAKHKDCIVVATIQTFSKYRPEDYGSFFDIVIVDEVHHANASNSQYGKVIQSLLAPRKYGLTATTPTQTIQSLTNEGFFGEVIAQLTEEEGQKAGLIANIKINLVPVPYNAKLNQKCQKRYKDYYKYCIVQSRERNIRIVDEVKKSLDAGEQVLILVEAIKHGHKIKSMIQRRLKKSCTFVHGSTDKEKRKNILFLMKKRKLQLAIASRVWKEGINIPSLNHIINACGMKEEKAVIQALGRGLRVTEDKTEVKLTDFLDPYKYLAEHSILRMQVYAKKGWL